MKLYLPVMQKYMVRNMAMVNAICVEIAELLSEFIQVLIFRFGTLANNELRGYRKQAHYWFDKLWQKPTRIFTRYNAYRWLAYKMHLKREDTHIANFEIKQCKQVIKLVKQRLGVNEKALWI